MPYLPSPFLSLRLPHTPPALVFNRQGCTEETVFRSNQYDDNAYTLPLPQAKRMVLLVQGDAELTGRRLYKQGVYRFNHARIKGKAALYRFKPDETDNTDHISAPAGGTAVLCLISEQHLGKYRKVR